MQQRQESETPSPAEPAAAPSGSALRIEPLIVRWLSLASIHNGLPILRGLSLKWQGEGSIENVRIQLRSEPKFTVPSSVNIARLEAGEAYRAEGVQVQPQAQFIAELRQAQTGTLNFEARSGEQLLAQHAVQLRLLPMDQWLGVQDIPELLAAYIQPGHPFITRVLTRAAQLLKRTGQDGFSGYRRHARELVGKQIAAIYASLREEKLTYVNPPARFETNGQRVRLPDQVEAERSATSLDLVLLFAAALEQVGLHPLVLFKKEHAWLGCWMDDAPSLSSPFDEDGHTLRKRHAIGEIYALELTYLCQASVLAAQAAKAGAEHFAAEADFVGALDVRMARRVGIRALPARVGGHFVEPVSAPLPAPESRQVEAPPAPSAQQQPSETSTQRLERWKRRLLDLSLRNRLINFKPTSKTLRVLGKQLTPLEDALAEGKAFGFEINPRFDQQQDATTAAPVPAELAQQRLDAHVTAALERGKLVLLEDDKHKVESRLVELLRTARTAEEEGGISPLYLALGMLEWKEGEAGAVNRAPILLMPVVLERSSVRAGLSGLKLTSRDEDTRVNPTLLEKMRRDFGVALEAVDVLPADGKGVDVARVLSLFKQVAVTRAGWDVKEELWLGEFSFRKFVMWRDLQECETSFKAHPLLRQMLEQPHTPLPQQGAFPDARELDNTLSPEVVFTPLIADSSQLAAIQAAAQGRSFVLEGPPGTGKSQTITNLIAHCLAHGKTVLFVSEKRAALEVVRRRLHELQLGPYCLEVHSDKARKAEIIAQLKAPLASTPANVDLQWSQVCGSLGRTRRTLNQYVQALHERFPCGLSIFDCTSWLSTHSTAPFVRMSWGSARDWNRPPLEQMRSAVAEIPPILTALGNPAAHPLVGTTVDDWSPPLERTVSTALEAVRTSALELQEASEIFGGRLTLPVSDFDDSELEELIALAESFIEFGSLPSTIGGALGDAEAQEALTSVAADLQKYRDAGASLFASYKDTILKCNVVKLERCRQQYAITWWPRSMILRRRLRGTLRSHIRERVLFETVILDAADDLERLRTVQSIGTTLALGDPKMRVLLGKDWQQQQTDPALLLTCAKWLQQVAGLVQRLGRLDVARVGQLMSSTKALLEVAQREGAEGELRKQIDRLLTARNGMRDAIVAMSACLKPAPAPAGSSGLGACNSLADLIGWAQRAQATVAADNLRYWAAWRRVRTAAAEMGLQPLLDQVEQGKASGPSLLDLFDASVRHWLLEEGLAQSTALRNFIGQSHDHLIEQFRKLDAEYVTTAGKAAAAQVDKRLPRQATSDVPSAEFGLLNREINKKIRHRPLRQLFGGMPTLLPRLKPCLLMSPLSVAQHLDPSFPPFDLVVFDEASQIPVWDALGAIARARQVIIVGDPKQMPPTAFFNRVEEDQELDDVAEDLESILDETMTTLPVMRLNWHYRSRYESLITFSNRNYYGGELVTFPSPTPRDRAVRMHRVYGVYGRAASRNNPLEAEAVVAFVLQHLRSELGPRQSIGIVTFNMQQQRLIEDLLDKARADDSTLDQHFQKQPGREEVFVKNLENVQGDERDLIVFSTTFGVDDGGRMSLNFGPINGANGPRRLNVAVTRARLAIHVFSSIWPDALDISRTSSKGVQHLKEFLEYAERGGPAAQVAWHDGSTPVPAAPEQTALEQSIAAALRTKGWEVHHQIGSGGYKLDLAVVAPHTTDRYLLAIECDGSNYIRGATARDRDRLRQIKLEELGWKLHRVWSTDWWRRQSDVLAALDAKLKALAEASRPAAASSEPV